MSTHFKVIVPMFNCERWAEKCLSSIIGQTYPNWKVIIGIEPCQDETYGKVLRYLERMQDKRVWVVKNPWQKHVPKNHMDCIHLSLAKNEDVIVCVDGDDYLFDKDVLAYLDSIYQNPDVWVTWGSYIFDHNKKVGGASRPMPDPDLPQRDWRYSHLKTFRHFLFKGIPDEALRDTATGNYYIVGGDMALMYPMVEIAGRSHSRFIDRVMYVYNQSTPYNDEKIHAKLCVHSREDIERRPRFKERTKEELCAL